MKRILISFFIGLPVYFSAFGQQTMTDSLASLFFNQLMVFPQEKIYLHTDKPCYITGEKLWFRAHLVDAATHIPSPVSRYVYVELFNPLDSLITRIKIKNDNDAYHGHIEIPEDLPEGDYLLRAYTKFMLNLDEHYLSAKTIHIANPKNRKLLVDVNFSFDSDRKTNVDFSFLNPVDSAFVSPGKVQMRINDGKKQNLKVETDGTTRVAFKLPVDVSKRLLLLEVNDATYSYRKYIPVPVHDNDFEVSFYPEGGHLLPGVRCRVTFKALQSNGRPVDIEGIVYDQAGKEVDQFKSSYLGMGYFSINPDAGTSYYAVCTNDKNQSKRFELPSVLQSGYTLSAGLVKDNLYVSVLKSAMEVRNDTLYLIAHTRGEVYVSEHCDENRKNFLFPCNLFPSGVLHLILFDTRFNPVSERLIFINNNDRAQVSYETKRRSFVARSLVDNRIALTDADGSPLTGSFSVSVTDDSAVPLDSTANILTQLLLTSDLRGHIENPAAYFSKEPSLASRSLDLLMLSQGWRRYDIPALAQNKPEYPAIPLETSYKITGSVKRLLIDKPFEKSKVSIVSSNVDYFDVAEPDKEGRFSFNIGDPTDSISFIVQVVPKSKKQLINLELLIDAENFAERTLPVVAPAEIKKEELEQYVEKAEQSFKKNKGIWAIDLSEVMVTARKPLPKSVVRATYVIEENEIQSIAQIRSTTMATLLSRIPGIMMKAPGGTISEIQYHREPLQKLTIDDEVNPPLKFQDFLSIINEIDPEKVKTIYLSEIFMGMKDVDPIFSGRGTGILVSVPLDDNQKRVADLVVICKNVNDIFYAGKQFHIKTVQPIGCQQPVAFYAPKYDTPESKANTMYDFRTTIHWQPDVQTDSLGIASFDFYTADLESDYTLIIEGVTTDGKIIHLVRPCVR